MKKLTLLLFVTAAAIMAACTGPTPTEQVSLKVTPPKLEFAASGAPSQTITVTVTGGVRWNHKLSASGEGWVTVSATQESTLIVTVSDNETSEQRTATVTVNIPDREDISPVGVTIIQAPGKEAEQYSISVDPPTLTFEADATESKEVTVTATGEGLTWTAQVEDGASWLHAETNGSKITVSVDPYDSIESDRAANIIITPSEASASPKAVRVTQKALDAIPSLTVTPDDDIHFTYNDSKIYSLTVNAVAIKKYSVLARDADDNPITWIKFTIPDQEVSNLITVQAEYNSELEPRSGYLIIRSNVEGVDDVKILVEQDAGIEHVSNLTGDAVIEDMEPAGGFYFDIFPNQEWDTTTPYTYWVVELWSGGLTREFNKGYYDFRGSGQRIRLKLYSPSVLHNYDDEYYLPEGDYTIMPYTYPIKKADVKTNSLESGVESNDLRIPVGSWYTRVENDQFTDTAPLTEGKMTVAKDEQDVYTFTFDFKDDAGNSITGTCVSEVTSFHVTFFPEDKPNSDQDNPGDDTEDPDFGV